MNTAALIEQQLGIPGQYGPWWTARRLLQEVWKDRPSVIRDCSFDLRDLPFQEAAQALGWRREITPDMIGKHGHFFDKNGAYLSAMRGVKNGIGDPAHVWDGDDNTRIIPGLPGIYRLSITRLPPGYMPYDGSFPPILEPTQEWVTNDVLMYAQSKGYEFTIIEAWVFNDYAKILDPWALKLWEARQYFYNQPGPPSLRVENDEAYRKMKLIAVVGNGAWNTNKKTHPGIDLIHPNWWADVVSKSRVNVLCNLEKFAQFGCVPVLIEDDGLWFVTRDDSYRAAVPGIFERAGKLGGYNPEKSYSFLITEKLYEQAHEIQQQQKPEGTIVGELVTLFKGQKVKHG